MTRNEFLEKVEELKESVNDLIDEKADKLLKSGAIDLKNYDNDFRLPKMFMCAIGNEIKFQYKPLYTDKQVDEEIFNLGVHL